MTDGPDAFLQPSRFVDSDDPGVIAFAEKSVTGIDGERERALALYYAVRDGIGYDPYCVGTDPDYYRAGACLARGSGFCIPKAALLTACARAVGISARVGYADVRNHLSTPRLDAMVGGDVYHWHSYTEMHIDGSWVKSTPAFDAALCERLGVHALEFDGINDSLFQEYNRAGDPHMEYLADRGTFTDVPFAEIVADFERLHPVWLHNLTEGDAQPSGN
jgi:transglutaminase-like putative cysteine protease